MKEIFNQQFKFKINDGVRHKADTKGFTADMGLLILERHLIESEDSDGNRVFERNYVCRMIRFSGSGELARFNERELMTVAEHEKQKIEDQAESNKMREDVRMYEKEVMEVFGIKKEDYLHEIVNGEPDKTKKFRMSGFSSIGNVLKLLVVESLFTASNRSEDNEKIEREKREWTNKNQFQKAE